MHLRLRLAAAAAALVALLLAVTCTGVGVCEYRCPPFVRTLNCRPPVCLPVAFPLLALLIQHESDNKTGDMCVSFKV